MIKRVLSGVMAGIICAALILGYHEFDCGYWRRKAEKYVEEKYDYALVLTDCVRNDGYIEYRAYDQYGDLLEFGVVSVNELK